MEPGKPDEPSLEEKRELFADFGRSEKSLKSASSFLHATTGSKFPLATLRRWLRDVEIAEERGSRVAAVLTSRPLPPEDMQGGGLGASRPFAPALDLAEWVRETFLQEDGRLCIEEHAHLRTARLGFLWTTVGNARQMNTVVGQCEIPGAQGGKWLKERVFFQLMQWFGWIPDFLITLHAPYAAEVSDAHFCSIVDHELCHAGQAKDIYGAPKYNKDGFPVFAIRGHDVEEFVGPVRRWGMGNAAGQTAQLVEAALMPPEFRDEDIAWACGNCIR